MRKKELVECLEREIFMLELDFEDAYNGDKARLLCKHYKRILGAVKNLE